MKFAAGLPIMAMSDPVAIRDFAQALDGAEFDVLSTAGHVLAVPPGRFPDRPTPTYAGPFHDPFVLFGYLAAITQRIHFRTGILILPLLPTALVAKQAAELQLLSGGRFELGVGISWNTLEYQALNQDFKARGKNGHSSRRSTPAEARARRTVAWETPQGDGELADACTTEVCACGASRRSPRRDQCTADGTGRSGRRGSPPLAIH